MTARRFTQPNAYIDPAVDEMMHSLLDGTAKRRYDSSKDPAAQDEKPKRAKITLPEVFKPDYLR